MISCIFRYNNSLLRYSFNNSMFKTKKLYVIILLSIIFWTFIRYSYSFVCIWKRLGCIFCRKFISSFSCVMCIELWLVILWRNSRSYRDSIGDSRLSIGWWSKRILSKIFLMPAMLQEMISVFLRETKVRQIILHTFDKFSFTLFWVWEVSILYPSCWSTRLD